MNILITGASGLIGSATFTALQTAGHRVAVLRRLARPQSASGPYWNPDEGFVKLGSGGPFDAVIHLAGETIAQRWTPAAKARIRESRVKGTRLLSEALAIQHSLSDPSLNGPVNGVSPNPVTNLEFTRTLGRVLRRPTVFSVPVFAIRRLFGQMGEEAMLSSTRVIPRRLTEAGFPFRFPELEAALRHAVAPDGNRSAHG